MITGAHVILYSRDAEADRAFLRDLLGLRSVDAGGGWTVVALPPAEVAVHPADTSGAVELYLVCDDVERTVAELTARGVPVLDPVTDQGWGRLTTIGLPGGGRVGLYEARHPTAFDAWSGTGSATGAGAGRRPIDTNPSRTSAPAPARKPTG